MPFAFRHPPVFRLRTIALAFQLAGLSFSAIAQASPDAEAGAPLTITGKKIGMGLMVQEDTPKARSTITAEELAKQRPTGNVFQALELMPAVNSYNYDATGLFGGGLSMRGFNSDQIGATINGVPVNDSGSFSVYPQEYVDQENVCSEYVTQGSTDVDSPQVGASGGNFGITTCDPADKRNTRVMQTLGQLHLKKTYVRYDTGIFSDGRSKMFISASHAEADKWKGLGGARRDHVDAGFNYDIDRFNSIHATVLYNQAVNNNILSMTLNDLRSRGYSYDYATSFVGHKPATPGVADVDAAQSPAYYKLAANPFENAITSAVAKFRLGDNTDIKIIPYFWYGYGTGGTQQNLVSESGFLNAATGKLNAGVDLNGDGDTKDKVIVANSSVTRTFRPGVTASLTQTVGDHTLLTGVWYERATHRQTSPAVLVDASGNPADPWLRSGLIQRPDGTAYEYRDWKTVSTAYQFFLQDTVSLMADRLKINFGVRTPFVNRNFTNYASEGSTTASSASIVTSYNGVSLAQTTYNIQKTYADVLPQLGLRYQLTHDDQLFSSLAKNFKAPPNFVFSPTNNSVQFNSAGNVVLTTAVKPETSYNLDLGYRHQSDKLTAQATVFLVDFQNRQATTFDQNTGQNILVNAGRVKNKGFEVELGNTPVNGWSFYSSLGYIKSAIQNDLLSAPAAGTTPVLLSTTGKLFPNTPQWKAGLSGSYETSQWYVRTKAKYTGVQQATLVNDETVPGYTTIDLDAGYLLAPTTLFKHTKLTFNISNLLNRQYRNASGQTFTTALGSNGAKISSPTYYLGAPRMVSATLSMDF